MASNSKVWIEYLDSDDSTLCFSNSSQSSPKLSGCEIECDSDSNPSKRQKTSHNEHSSESEIEILEVDSTPVKRDVEIIRFEPGKKKDVDIEVIKVIPGRKKGKL